jgi:hypothetical protein
LIKKSLTLIRISLIIVQLTIAPSSSYEREHSKHLTTTTAATDEEEGEPESPGDTTLVNENGDRVVGIMFGKTASEQIYSLWWL